MLPKTGILFIVSAPSGAGKTSLLTDLIVASSDISVCISHTTRPKRQGERDGIDYHFVERAEFERMVAAGEFLEHARVFGHYYGTSKAAATHELESGKDVVLEIDWQGARQIRSLIPEAVSIFIVPPSLDELRQRLERRGQDDGTAIQRRMREAIEEVSHLAEYDYLVVNDDFHRALADLQAVVRSERLRTPIQRHRLAGKLAGLMASR